MKNKIIAIAWICTIFISCGEDRRKEYAGRTAPNRWIESTLLENYYWYEDVPTSGLNYFGKPSAFLSKLVSKKDTYSYIEDPENTGISQKYGFTYDASIRYNNDTAYAVRVLYVDSDSPAQAAGLERGDWIIKRNGKFITRTRLDSLKTGNAIELTRGEYEVIEDDNHIKITHFKDKDVVQVAAARITKDNPIHFYDAYLTPSGKKVGYLVYNHFTSGEGESDFTYDNALRTISNAFNKAGLTDFILDLRYNTGGSLESARLLGSILAPATAIGKEMCHLKYNNLQSNKNETLHFNQEILGSGSNLNLEKIYILTGTNTASTSEVLIGSLQTYEKVICIGSTTKGNFTGLHTYENKDYPFILHIVDCMVYDPAEQYAAAFTPAYAADELKIVTLFPFGHPYEYLLGVTLGIIDNNGELPQKENNK